MRMSPEMAAKCLELAGETTVNRKAKPPADLPGTRVNYRIFGVLIPFKLVSEANTGGRFRAKLARKKAAKEVVALALAGVRPAVTLPYPPFRVSLHRLGVKLLDDDNLAHAFKAVRDVVAEWLGVDDGDTERVTFAYSQEKAKAVGIKITIEEV